jgi:hypothetical protein
VEPKTTIPPLKCGAKNNNSTFKMWSQKQQFHLFKKVELKY